MNALEILFIIFLVATVVFWIMKKRIPCFLCSLLACGIYLAHSIMLEKGIQSIFWALCIIIDLYEYYSDHWNFYGYFGEE